MIRPLAHFTVRPLARRIVKVVRSASQGKGAATPGIRLKAQRLELRLGGAAITPGLKVIGRPGKTRAC